MIAFLTLFLGLVTGAHLVEIAVSDPAVTTVELDLDGRTVAVLHQPPWSTVVDLGDQLTPHELVARGRDAQGVRVAEIRQWINLPRDRAELEILLERDSAGVARRGQLLWSSVDAAAPEAVRISFDGQALESADWRTFEIPRYDPSSPHLLQAELTAGGNTARAQLVVGGGGSTAVNGELTAVLVALDGKAKVPSPAEMDGWLRHRGTDLRVVAVEQPGADVVMVQDLDWTVQGLLNRLRQEMLAPRVASQNRPTGLKSRDEYRILFPIPEVSEDASTPSVQFPQTPNLWSGQEQETFSRGAAQRQIATPIPQGVLVGIPVNAERRIDTSRQSLADATAAAGLAVVAGRRGRAIILVAGSETADQSRSRPQQVRSYLADLQVPLVVWSPQPDLVAPEWGEVHPITNRPQLTRTIRELRELLDRQVVVWVEGSYLPHEISLTPRADGRLTALVSTPGQAPAPRPHEPDPFEPDGVLTATLEPPPQPTTPTPSTPPQQPARAVLGETGASFADSTEVRLQTVEVVVTDSDGALVPDLRRDELTIEVDDQPVEITFFEPPANTSERANTQPELEGEATATATTNTPEDPGALVVYLDLASLDLAARARVFGALEATLLEAGPEQQILIAVQTKALAVELPLTNDRELVRAALAELASRPMTRTRDPAIEVLNEIGRVQEEMESTKRIRDPIERQLAIERALASRTSVQASLSSIAAQERREVLELIHGLNRFVVSLAGLEGPRSLLYVGARLTPSPAAELFEEARRTIGDPQGSMAGEAGHFEVRDELDELGKLSRDAGVTFFAVTPFGLDDAGAITSSSAGAPGGRGRLAGARQEARSDASCGLAQMTAGLCQVGGSDVAGFLGSVLSDRGSSYSVGFLPPHEADGERHRVALAVKRPGLTLRYRESYRAQDSDARLLERLGATLLLGHVENPHQLQVDIVEQRPTAVAGVKLVHLQARVPVAQLALSPAAAGAYRIDARLLVQSMDADSRTPGPQEFPLSFEVTEAQLANPQLLYQHDIHLQLAGGKHVVAIGLWDRGARIGSFARLEIDVEPGGGPGR